jgi:Porin subfamily
LMLPIAKGVTFRIRGSIHLGVLMKIRSAKGAVALGGLTATVALLAGLGSAQAQMGAGQAPTPPVAPTSGPGAGSFPQSFLIPGTNTSLSLYGKIALGIQDNIGSQHFNDTSPSGGGGTPFPNSAIAMEGPGAAGGTNFLNLDRSLHGGLRAAVKGTNFAFETRTPSDLGEIKTVMLVDFSLNASQSNYVGSGTAVTSNKPAPAAGNNEIPRIQWAYGTLGPWLIGQYNSAWADPLQTNPDIGDQAQVGPLQTVNIRRPQIRYTYLAGNGITLSGSLESMVTGAQYCQNTTGAAATTCIGQAGVAAAALATDGSDNLDVGGNGDGGLADLPSFNTGISWDQPWGHLMTRIGAGRSELKGTNATTLFNTNASTVNFTNNVTQWHWAAEGGAMINTWGQDQWRGLVNYSHGMSTYMSDMGSGSYDMFINGQTGQVSAITELAFNTSYIHRFSPNWRATAEFGVGFFSKPDSAKGLGNCANNTAVNLCVSGGANAAQLASIEKRHIQSAASLTYSPIPGQVDIAVELDYYDRQVQATGTGGAGWTQRLGFNFYW